MERKILIIYRKQDIGSDLKLSFHCAMKHVFYRVRDALSGDDVLIINFKCQIINEEQEHLTFTI